MGVHGLILFRIVRVCAEFVDVLQYQLQLCDVFADARPLLAHQRERFRGRAVKDRADLVRGEAEVPVQADAPYTRDVVFAVQPVSVAVAGGVEQAHRFPMPQHPYTDRAQRRRLADGELFLRLHDLYATA